MDLTAIVAENERRKEALSDAYDPIKGEGSYGERAMYDAERWGEGDVLVPTRLLADAEFRAVRSKKGYVKARCRYDFEYWCVMCVKVKDKTSGRDIAFRLNPAQRKMLAVIIFTLKKKFQFIS